MSEKEEVSVDGLPDKQKLKVRKKTSKVIMLRNRFFYLLYRNSLVVFITSLLIFFSSLGFILFFANKPVSPQYIAVNEDGTYITLSPLSECYDIEKVREFILKAIDVLYRYDYYNYGFQINQGAQFFLQSAWGNYAKELGASKTLEAVKNNRWVVSVKPSSSPELLQQGYSPEGVCYWDMKIPVQLFFIGDKGQMNEYNLYFRVSRNSVINNPEGLGISRIIQEAKSTN